MHALLGGVGVGVHDALYVYVFEGVLLGVLEAVPVPEGVGVDVGEQGRTSAISICLHVVPEMGSSGFAHEYDGGHAPQSCEQL